MGAAHLDDRVELTGLASKSGLQFQHGRQQPAQLVQHGNMHGGREGVVGALGHVDVRVRAEHRVIPAFLAHEFQGAVGDHLVGVHVDAGARPALDRVDDEVLVPASLNDLGRRPVYGVRQPQVQVPGVRVGQGRRLFDQGHRADQAGGQALARDREVLDGPHGLHAVQRRHRHLLLTQEIVLGSVGHPLQSPPFFTGVVWPGETAFLSCCYSVQFSSLRMSPTTR